MGLKAVLTAIKNMFLGGWIDGLRGVKAVLRIAKEYLLSKESIN